MVRTTVPRKSVAFDLTSQEEAPRSVRATRASVGRGLVDGPSQDQPPQQPPPAATAAAVPLEASQGAAASSSSSKRARKKEVGYEKEGGFKFKRTKKQAPAPAPVIDEPMLDCAAQPAPVDVLPPPPPPPPLDATPMVHPTAAITSTRIAAAPRAAAPAAAFTSTAVAPAPPTASAAASAATAIAASSAASSDSVPPLVVIAPPPPSSKAPLPDKPSVLAGAPKQLLHALHEVCTELAAQSTEAASSSSDAGDAALPTMDFALSACFDELRKVGVTSAPPPNEERAKLEAAEKALEARVAELEQVVSQWDAAVNAPLEELAGTSSSTAEPAMPEDTRLLPELPEAPPIGEQLEELGFLAGMCAEQVELATRQVRLAVASAEAERVRLAKAVHQVTFKGYLDVEQPKSLIRGLLAA